MSATQQPVAGSTAKLVVPFSSKDLVCVNKCGFYGNPQWQGMCSKCWREHQKQQHAAASSSMACRPSDDDSNVGTLDNLHIKSSKSVDVTSPSKAWSTFGFDKFLEKKTQQTNKRASTLKSILKKSPSSDCASQISATIATPTAGRKQVAKKPERQLSDESLKVKADLLKFLHTLPRQVAYEISKEVTVIVQTILSRRREFRDVDELSEFIQDAYQGISEKLRLSTTNQIVLPCSSNDVMNEVERFVCFTCYDTLFSPTVDEEVVDLSLQDRIRSLHWVTYGFLDSGIELDRVDVRDSFDTAVTEIVEVNSKRDPQAKLECIVKCSQTLLECLKLSRNGQPASADEFLPALIFVLLKCNPPMLQSNINFVARFSLPAKLMSGEAGYYFTNLCCALNFVQNLNADSLKMPREEFEAYTSGLASPLLVDFSANSGPGSAISGAARGGKCPEAVRAMERSLEEVKSMQHQVDRLLLHVQSASEREQRQIDELVAKAQSLRADDETNLANENDPGVLEDLLGQANPNDDVTLPAPLTPSVILD